MKTWNTLNANDKLYIVTSINKGADILEVNIDKINENKTLNQKEIFFEYLGNKYKFYISNNVMSDKPDHFIIENVLPQKSNLFFDLDTNLIGLDKQQTLEFLYTNIINEIDFVNKIKEEAEKNIEKLKNIQKKLKNLIKN